MVITVQSNPSNKAASIFFTLVLVTGAASAAGRTAFPLMHTSLEPRALALGGAPAAVFGSPELLELNPASAAFSRQGGSASYGAQPAQIWSGRLRYIRPIAAGIIGGIGIANLDYGRLSESVAGSGLTGAEFGAGEWLVTLNAAGGIGNRIALGAAVDLAGGRIGEANASGVAVDIGAIWDTDWEQVMVGLALRNAGTLWDGYGERRDPLPTGMALGIGKQLEHLPLTMHLSGLIEREGEGDYHSEFIPGNGSLSFAAGGEFKVDLEGYKHPLFLRFGYTSRGRGQNTGQRLDSLAGFGLGFGLRAGPIKLDYGLGFQGGLGETQRLGIAADF